MKAHAPPRDRQLRSGPVVVAVLFGLIGLTAGGILFVRTKFGPAKACDYGAPTGCGPNEICAVSVGGQGRCLLYATQSEPMIPPFPAPTAFACRQGPRAPKEQSHAWATDVYAVDLMPSPSVAEAEVVAPISGEARVYDRCEERDASPNATNSSNCGAGYGNHIRIWDGTDIVLLGHLARATVKDGARVERGQRIGIAGVSGSAGARHVHLVVTRLRPGDYVDTILQNPGHKGGVVTNGVMLLRDPSGRAVTKHFDELGCAKDAAEAWTAP